MLTSFALDFLLIWYNTLKALCALDSLDSGAAWVFG